MYISEYTNYHQVPDNPFGILQFYPHNNPTIRYSYGSHFMRRKLKNRDISTLLENA